MQKTEFLEALIKEISFDQHFIQSEAIIETVYFGGGTPSVLTEQELSTILESLHKKFNIAKNAEITLEANPDDINEKILQRWKNNGINRLSLGVQSFNESELRWMNRAHSADESLKSIDQIQEAGFHNFSVDLIFGSPLLSDEELKKNLEIIYDKNIPHISCYALTVEPRTPLNKLIALKKSLPIDNEKQARQFRFVMNAMKKQGYEQYEISNFAKPGLHSRHNSSYWQAKPYYGFGASAHSFDGKNKRRWNIANNALYIQSLKNNLIPFEEEVLSLEQRFNEYMMTSLRTSEGIDTKFMELEFGLKWVNQFKTAVQKYIDGGKVIIQNENFALTDEGKLFADGIAADLFF